MWRPARLTIVCPAGFESPEPPESLVKVYHDLLCDSVDVSAQQSMLEGLRVRHILERYDRELQTFQLMGTERLVLSPVLEKWLCGGEKSLEKMPSRSGVVLQLYDSINNMRANQNFPGTKKASFRFVLSSNPHMLASLDAGEWVPAPGAGCRFLCQLLYRCAGEIATKIDQRAALMSTSPTDSRLNHLLTVCSRVWITDWE